MSWVATRQDLLTLGGLPAAAYVPDARQIAAVYVPQSTLELPGHGCAGGEPVRFSARPGSTLYTGISALTWYSVAPTADPDFFTLLLNGVPVVLSDAGAGAIFLSENIWPKIDKRLLARTSWVIACAKAYAGPWTTPPDWAPQLVAQLVAFDVATWLRLPAARFPIDDVRAQYTEAQKFIDERLDKGIPYSDGVGPIDATPKVAEMGAKAVRLQGRGFLSIDEREGCV